MRGVQCKRDVRAASMLPEGSKAPAALPRLRTTRTRHLGRLGSCGTETAARLQEIVACRVRPRKPLFQSFRASVLALGAAMAAAALHVYISPMLFFELLIVVALILLNGVLAMAELAVVSSRRARLQALVNREVVGARRALALASDPGRFLSTVQIGITLNGVLSGAFSGATLGQRLVQWFVAVGLSPAIAEIVGVGLVVAAITARNDRRSHAIGRSPGACGHDATPGRRHGRFIGRSGDYPAHTPRERTFAAARSRRCARRHAGRAAGQGSARSIFAR